MNSYQKKNDYEILNASPSYFNTLDSYPRYPLANDPQASMQTTNYKDWQNECEGITPSGFGAFSFIIAIIMQFQSFLSEPSLSGALGIGLDIADSLIADDVSQLSAREVRDLIQSGLTDLAISIASGSFNDIVEKYRDYLEVFKRWESGGRTDDDTRETIGRLIMDAERAAAELNQFSHGDYKIPLLPTYAQAANLHLKILRDILIHGEDLQIISTADRQFYRDKLFGGLKNYTNYCVDQYNAGLNQIKEAGTSAANWLRFHRFRREMTLSVLDLIALFPTYDIDSYDLPVNVELSRIIYTDPVGWTVEGMSTIYPWYSPYNRLAFNQLEAETIRGPYLSTWLDYIDIYSSQYSSLKVWSGNANTMKTIGGETRRQDGSAVGTPQRITVGNTDIFKVELTAGVHHFLIDYTNPNPLRSYGIINSKFFMTNGSTPTYTGSVGSMHTQTGKVAALPGVESEVPTANDYTHRLSDVINLTGGLPQHGSNSVRSSLVAHGWTHKSLKRENIIEANQISQIPAVKSYSMSGGLTVRHVSDHTGGDVVYFAQVGRVKILCKFTSPGYYKMRIRYASEYSATMTVNGIPVSLSSTTQVRSNLPYEAFQYAQVGPNHVFAVLTPKTLEFDIYGGVNGLMIDKIEFIPSNITTLEYEEERDLEKTKNAVNDLFIN